MKGIFWSFTDLLANHGLQFLIHIILARILLPDSFGLIGMILIFIAISNLFVNSGFSQALIRDQEANRVDYSTVFYFNLGMAILLYGLLFISAGPISEFYNEPQLTMLLRVLGLTMVVNSLGMIQKVLLFKKVDFKTLTKVNLIAVFLSGGTTILLALKGFGVWSLVVNTFLMQSAQTILLWLFTKWRPLWAFSWTSFKKYFTFGYKLLLSELLDTTYNNIYFVIIGRLYSTAAVGYYTNAVKFRDLASLSISIAVQRVTYPVLSSIQDDQDRLKYGYQKIIRTTGFIHFPLMVGLAAIAYPLFNLLLEEKWLPSVIYFQLLCFAGMLYPIHSINLNILQVKGRSDLFLRLEIIKKLLWTFLIVMALLLKLGILGLIWAAVLISFISLLLNTYYSAREIGYSTGEQLLDLGPSFILSIVMGGAVYLASAYLSLHPLAEMLLLISLGVICYLALCMMCKLRELRELYELLRPVFLRMVRLKKFQQPK
ncbi:lipopolysaccharide biosynthesis protein [Sporosarcina sp. 179-K 3D1 HS]|uniref:lipopolysaccharide biosynthesis protein n=1 Tax=Sporosarcina sp. 179-K 3D1 HS TaxID=3232169 RepID=UPI0039A1AD89